MTQQGRFGGASVKSCDVNDALAIAVLWVTASVTVSSEAESLTSNVPGCLSWCDCAFSVCVMTPLQVVGLHLAWPSVTQRFAAATISDRDKGGGAPPMVAKGLPSPLPPSPPNP